MLTINKTVLPSPAQWEIIIEGMRNPKNSWDRSDSYITHIEDAETLETADFEFFLGEADQKLMLTLRDGGPVHAKYRRMIPVFLTLTAPLYWHKEMDTYRTGVVCNSCSTMHKIHAKEFTLDDFSCDHLRSMALNTLNATIRTLNHYRALYLASKDKTHWWQLIQLLPSSYNQRRTYALNYEVLANIYRWRKDHKLDEWHTFCDWIRTLPHSYLITGDEEASV